MATVHVVAKSQTRLSVHSCFLISNFAICQNQRSFNFLQARLLQFFSNKEWGGNIRTPRHLESSRVFYCFFFCLPVRYVGSLFPCQRWNPRPLRRKPRVLTAGLPGKPRSFLLLFSTRKTALQESDIISLDSALPWERFFPPYYSRPLINLEERVSFVKQLQNWGGGSWPYL